MKKKVIVIGSGISGISTSYFLDKMYDVTLIESEERLGGHTHTHTITNSDGDAVHVDMGFIVFNTKNYPLFTQFLHELNVPYHNADMSFGFYDRSKNFWYSSKIPKGIFSQKKNLFSPSYISMLLTINRFNKQALADLNSGVMKELSLGQYLDTLTLSPRFKYHYIYPMGAAIWSCPISEILSFPAYSFFSFWKNHELLTLGKRPQWKTITQGSQSYINAFRSVFSGKILTKTSVKKVSRESENIAVYTHLSDTPLLCDYVVIATHADTALSLLEKPTKEEKTLLGAWSYSKNEVVLHTDSSVMPPKESGWASWLVQKETSNKLMMSYYMNSLQNIPKKDHYFVTLNGTTNIKESRILKKLTLTHPIFNKQTIQTQHQLKSLNKTNCFFCGSYFGYGFHEDGIRSGYEVAQKLKAMV